MSSDAKAGKDAGELCGRAPVGVRATTDADAMLKLDADCVCYTATADLRPFEAIDDLCRILAAGKNVVSSSVVPLVHPSSFVPELRDRLAEACKQGGTSFFTSGIDPGFANDVLPLTMTGLCQRWEEVRVLEIINYATYNQPTGAVRHHGLRQAARRRAAAADARHAELRLGRHGAPACRGAWRRPSTGSTRPTNSGRR